MEKGQRPHNTIHLEQCVRNDRLVMVIKTKVIGDFSINSSREMDEMLNIDDKCLEVGEEPQDWSDGTDVGDIRLKEVWNTRIATKDH